MSIYILPRLNYCVLHVVKEKSYPYFVSMGSVLHFIFLVGERNYYIFAI
jgi:hypothetical protein